MGKGGHGSVEMKILTQLMRPLIMVTLCTAIPGESQRIMPPTPLCPFLMLKLLQLVISRTSGAKKGILVFCSCALCLSLGLTFKKLVKGREDLKKILAPKMHLGSALGTNRS